MQEFASYLFTLRVRCYCKIPLFASVEGALLTQIWPCSDVSEEVGPEGPFGCCLYHLQELELKTLHEFNAESAGEL